MLVRVQTAAVNHFKETPQVTKDPGGGPSQTILLSFRQSQKNNLKSEFKTGLGFCN